MSKPRPGCGLMLLYPKWRASLTLFGESSIKRASFLWLSEIPKCCIALLRCSSLPLELASRSLGVNAMIVKSLASLIIEDPNHGVNTSRMKSGPPDGYVRVCFS